MSWNKNPVKSVRTSPAFVRNVDISFYQLKSNEKYSKLLYSVLIKQYLSVANA
jgi:hypothetical protein